jgi:GWxTD domain-containing protein
MLIPAHRVLPVALAAATLASPAPAEGPTVDTRRFPKLVQLFLEPGEQEVIGVLKDDKDKREFQKIFWARRDPTAGTPANEFEDNVRAVWKHADDLFSYSNQRGSETGCGQVLALLGRPEEVLGKGDVPRQPTVTVGGREAREAPPAPGPGRPFDNMAYLREGSTREAETWVYRDRPGLPYRFTGAELRVAFDPECRFALGGTVLEDLRRVATAYVTRPELRYERGPDGRLLPVSAAAGGAAAGAGALLAAPRADFPLEAETKLVMRAPKGEAFVAGLLRAAAGATGTTARLSVAARATDAGGQATSAPPREMSAPPEPDGSLVASWGLALAPGRHTVTLAAQVGDRGSTTTLDVDVPDLGGAVLVASPLVLYPEEPPASGAPDPRDPFAALQLGPMRLHPRFGNVFTPQDALMVVATLHGGAVDPATGQAALRARFTVLKDGRPVARGAEDAFATADAVASVGPIPLSDYAPGAYVVRLDVTDKASGRTLRREAPLEIRKP